MWSTGWASATPRSSARNPGIVYCSTTGYGQDGPHAQWAGHDINYLAVGGFLAMSTPGGQGAPPLPGATIADAAAGGMQAALAITAALAGRDTTGPGRLPRRVGGRRRALAHVAGHRRAAGPGRRHRRPGHDVLSGRYACYGTYQAPTAWVAVGAIEREVLRQPVPGAGLRRAGGVPTTTRTPSPRSGPPSPAPSPPATRDEWVALLAGADTCVAPVLDVAEVAGDPQFVARGAVITATHPTSGTFAQLAPLLAGMDRPGGSWRCPT